MQSMVMIEGSKTGMAQGALVTKMRLLECIAALSLSVCLSLSLSLPPLALFLDKCKSLRIRQDLPVKHHKIVSSYGKEGRCISHGSALCDEHAELCINR